MQSEVPSQLPCVFLLCFCSCWLECIEGKKLSVLTDASRASYFREGLREERCSVCAKKLIFSVGDSAR